MQYKITQYGQRLSQQQAVKIDQQFRFATSSSKQRAKFQIFQSKGQINKDKIKVIFTDVDGTLINTKQEISPRVRDTIKKVQDKGILVIPATGKPVGKWLEYIQSALGENKAGVYLQGLSIFDSDGKIFAEFPLSDETVKQCIDFAKEKGITAVPYTRDRTFCEVENEFSARIAYIKEPASEPIGDLTKLLGNKDSPVIKFVFVAPEERCQEVRPDLEKMLGSTAVVTRALKGFLEVLPPGASKGAGVQIYLNKIGLKYEDVLAAGDGENDREMLEQAGVAVVMGNADDDLKKIADFVAPTNDEDGWAVAIEKILLDQ